LKAILKNKTSLVAGQSGVGKSTLINNIQPGLDLKTDEISDYSGKGQHTTTFAEMHSLSFGGYIIDTPGIKMLSYNNLEPLDVAHNFREFFKLSSECRFPNCLHKEEPGCAVKAAVENGSVSPLRYEHYLQIMSEVEDQNYWERHKDM
jgi:ribosome biogenesis GTPase